MPDAIAPVAPTPANGAKPSTPQTPAAPVAPAESAEAGALKAELAKVEASRRDIEKKERDHVVKVRKFSEEQKTLGAKLTRLSELEKRDQQAKLNPTSFLKGLYGDKWYDVVTEAKLNGVAPADLVQSEIERVREDFEKKLADKDAQAKAEREAEAKTAIEEARASLLGEAKAFVSSASKDYPIFEGYSPDTMAAILAQRIETEYNKAFDKNKATGAPTLRLSTKEAAELVEQDMLAIAEKAAAHEKYRPKLAEKMKPPTPAPVVGGPRLQRPEPQQRRTLSNDVTGSTPGKAPPVSDDERRQRAIAAFNAHHAKATT